MYMMFSNQDDKYKNYIKASQGGIVRFTKEGTSATVEGLCTDGTSACLTIIIINADKSRFSLIHTPLCVTEQALMDECEWINAPATMYIIRGVSYRDTEFEKRADFRTIFLPRMQQAIEAKHLNVNIDCSTYTTYPGSVAIDKEGTIICMPPIQIKNPMNVIFQRIGAASPGIEIRDIIDILNQQSFSLTFRYHPLDLQYDVNHWTECPVLLPQVKELLKQHRTQPHHDINFCYHLNKYIRYEEVTTNLNSKAVELFLEKKYDMAISGFVSTLANGTRLWGRENSTIVSMHYNLGRCYEEMKDLSQAREHMEQALAICKIVSDEALDNLTSKVMQRLEGLQIGKQQLAPT